MRRRHLLEIEDQPWCPDFYRDYLVDYLRYVSEALQFSGPIAAVIERGLALSGRSTIIDLGSGGGGGLPAVARKLVARLPDVKIVLTDLYPNRSALTKIADEMPAVFGWESDPVDARQVPGRLQGFRTLSLVFHHFRPEDAKGILRDAVDTGSPIAIFEPLERNLVTLAKVSLSSIAVFLLTPFMRPVRIGRFFWTYLIPLVPFGVTWDGMVSVLRVYRPDELRTMIRSVPGADRYRWEVGRVKTRTGLATIVFLLGSPR